VDLIQVFKILPNIDRVVFEFCNRQ